jgi:hypothetical protein
VVVVKTSASDALALKGGDGHGPGHNLQRLVAFLAAAFDARYAFVAGFYDPESKSPPHRMTFWVCRNYGLAVEVADVDLPDGVLARSATLDHVQVLRRIWPQEAELLAFSPARCLTVPLADDGGLVLGHLGILDAGPASRVFGVERLQPLARIAISELRGRLGA